MSETKLWNTDWEFSELKFNEDALNIPLDCPWKEIDIPHDWMIYDTQNLYRDSIGWYRKELHLDSLRKDDLILLRFDGVYMDSSLYINGHLAGEWKYGYSTFEIDITPFLHMGKNTVHLRVIYQSLNTRWYSGAGIYRNVWLKMKSANHILSDGIYITPVKLTDEQWNVEVQTEISLEENCMDTSDIFYLKQSILDGSNNIVIQDTLPIKDILSNDSSHTKLCLNQSYLITNPLLWDIECGNQYGLETQLWKNDTLIETETQKFGFRTLTFTADKGLFINGRHITLNGVCEHHDFGCLGAAFSTVAMKRKFLLLRQMGVNAIRTAHNMPAPEFMELADEMGFLIISEAFDMWERPKTSYDYARFFKDWYQKDVESWVRRDRNHPSLLMWSIGNEIADTHIDSHGQEITLKLIKAVREFDPKKHAPITIGSNFMKWENAQLCADLIDCVGYNYSEYLYESHHQDHPHWVIYGSETASVLASRGVYHFPKEKTILSDDDEQCSSLGNSTTGWGAKSYEACICADRDAKHSLGQFIWTGFDHLGEPTPYQTKNCYYGQLDTAGFPKDSFYIFQAEWTDYKKHPMVHLFPYWDFNKGQMIDVQVCSNAPMIELFLNQRSLGIHTIDHQSGKQLLGTWTIPYEKGVLEAVAYDENHKIIACDRKTSFTDPVAITASADRSVFLANGQDMAFVEIGMIDKDGYPVENARNRIHVEVKGAGRLIGLDNGDSSDFDQHKGKSRRLFSGKLLAVIATKQIPGEIRITLSSPGINDYQMTLNSLATISSEEISAKEENKECVLYTGGTKSKPLEKGSVDIPVRKIELTAIDGQLLDKNKNMVVVKAEIYPANATWQELEWKAVNDIGIDVSFVSLDVRKNENAVSVTAKGDGSFRLRCSCKNGGSVVSVRSDLEMNAIGIGTAVFHPYEEIYAGLCDYHTENAINGIDYGISFFPSEIGTSICMIGFDFIDFGDFGSDSITLPIFANTDNAVSLQIWDGNPSYPESSLLADIKYQKTPEWLVFQEETYHLNNRLKGIQSLYFVSTDEFQLRGFFFEKQYKGYGLLFASECTHIYGDTYDKKPKAIENIGNNVALAFEHMDFGENKAINIMICSRSRYEINPIQIRFTNESETNIQILEVPGSEDYAEQTFSIEPLSGEGNIEFIFLPGSQFDLQYFQFGTGE